mmetsp:Transcript_17930/g.57719  ORF Transcript_17930/g.57719 Transcript_17930/m.57719 type:complete len:234 (+) Transcript_17930:528-1229(+)
MPTPVPGARRASISVDAAGCSAPRPGSSTFMLKSWMARVGSPGCVRLLMPWRTPSPTRQLWWWDTRWAEPLAPSAPRRWHCATMQQCCFAQQALPASSRSGARNTATRPGMCSRDGMTTAAGVVRQAVTLRSFFGQGPTSTAALDTRITPATTDCVCLPMVTSAPSAGSTTMTTCHLCRHATLGGSTLATAATSCSIPSAGCPSTDGPNTKTTPLTPAAYRMRTTHSASTGTD